MRREDLIFKGGVAAPFAESVLVPVPANAAFKRF
jgi:hypothetical protein